MSLGPEMIKLILYQVLNCVGPYRFYGEVVVKACVENGAHHVDISGNFLKLLRFRYNWILIIDNVLYFNNYWKWRSM